MTRIRSLSATLLLMALLVSSASASTYTTVLHAYETTGTISPCQFSSGQLSAALKGVDTYGAQYFADFTNAIQSALAARAAGACTHHHAVSGSAGAKHGNEAGIGLPTTGPVTTRTDASVPAPIVLMAAIAAAFVVMALIGGVFRLGGWDPVWLTGWRHAWAEAGYRLGGTWSEFVDWLRPDR